MLVRLVRKPKLNRRKSEAADKLTSLNLIICFTLCPLSMTFRTQFERILHPNGAVNKEKKGTLIFIQVYLVSICLNV